MPETITVEHSYYARVTDTFEVPDTPEIRQMIADAAKAATYLCSDDWMASAACRALVAFATDPSRQTDTASVEADDALPELTVTMPNGAQRQF